MMSMIPMLALVGSLASAVDADAIVELPGDFVLVDRHAWLYTRPDEAALRLRPAYVSEAPEYAASPAVVLRTTARMGTWIRATVATHATPTSPQGKPAPPDTFDADWAHCYPQPPGMAQLGVDVWIREADLLQVTTRAVELALEDGSVIRVDPGVSVAGRAGKHRLRSHHMRLLGSLPADAVGTSYVPPTRGPGARQWVAVQDGKSFRVSPIAGPSLDLRSGTLELSGGTPGASQGVVQLVDRCVRVDFADPTAAIPPYDPTQLADAAGWPVVVPRGTTIHRRDGTRWGEVRSGDLPLWSRASCDWSEARGLCCDRLSGLEWSGEGDTSTCFDADLPTRVMTRDLGQVLGDLNADMHARSDAADKLVARVGWTEPVVRGVLTPAQVRASLELEADTLRYCYERGLDLDPTLAGEMSLRFAVAPDGRARWPTFVSGDFPDGAARNCVFRRVQALLVPDQVGQIASMVEVTLSFTSFALDAE